MRECKSKRSSTCQRGDREGDRGGDKRGGERRRQKEESKGGQRGGDEKEKTEEMEAGVRRRRQRMRQKQDTEEVRISQHSCPVAPCSFSQLKFWTCGTNPLQTPGTKLESVTVF